MSNKSIAIELIDIYKHFPGVQALDDVSIKIQKGEVHAIVGQNGAGKSTLVKILAGAYKPDKGKIYFDSKLISNVTPLKSRMLGISVIYQEFQLIPYLSVAENVFSGREPMRQGINKFFVDWHQIRKKTKEILEELRSDINPMALVSSLSISDQQIVEIAKALSIKSKIIVMDEPTSSLTAPEIERLFYIISKLKSRDVTTIYISHRLEEIFEIADSVTVLTNGKCISTKPIKEVNSQSLVYMMLGRNIKEMYPKISKDIGKEVLRVKELAIPGVLKNINLTVKKGEILGIFGFVGSGRTELAKAIFGAKPAASGSISMFGKRKIIRSVRDAIKTGIALIVEDRKLEGLFLKMSVLDNICIANLSAISQMNFINSKLAQDAGKFYVKKMNIKTPGLEHLTRNLSGGNQQKIVVAKWLFSKSPLIIFDEPTRGIDVGAKVEIYHIINSLAQNGIGIIMISSELSEVMGVSDRILIMRFGQIVREFIPTETTKEEVLACAIGNKTN